MARKTFSVEQFKAQVNAYLLDSRDDQRGERRGQQVALESVLHATGNYKGFSYLTERDMSQSIYGNSIGVRPYRDNDELQQMQESGTLFDGCDGSRVHYH